MIELQFPNYLLTLVSLIETLSDKFINSISFHGIYFDSSSHIPLLMWEGGSASGPGVPPV